MADSNKCAREICTCAATYGGAYCSPHCEAAGEGDVTEIACQCGCAGCGGEI